jgi:hypothetical protein
MWLFRSFLRTVSAEPPAFFIFARQFSLNTAVSLGNSNSTKCYLFFIVFFFLFFFFFFSFFCGCYSPGLLAIDPFRQAALLKTFSIIKVFYGVGISTSRSTPNPQPPTWRTMISLFGWIITFDLTSMGEHTSTYTTASIALRIT